MSKCFGGLPRSLTILGRKKQYFKAKTFTRKKGYERDKLKLKMHIF